jgi:alpha-1,6-mannosyltransferase
VPADHSGSAHPATQIARFGLPGLAGTAMLGVGAIGVGWLPLRTMLVDYSLVEVLRASTIGTLIAHVLVFAGIAVLLQVWLTLGFELFSGLRMSPGTLTGILAVWSVPLLVTPPMFSRDVYSYYLQGRLMQEGLDPYSTGVAEVPGWFQDGVDPMWAESSAPYGALFLLMSRGVANFAAEQPYLAALVFRIIALVGIALIIIYLPRLAFAHGIDPARALWLGAANPLVVLHFISGAHNDALMVGLIIAALAFASEGRAMAGAAVIALAAAVKPIALLALPFIGLSWAGTRSSWGRRITCWLGVTVIAGAVFAIISLVAGLGTGWIAALATPGEVRTWLSPATALGMASTGLVESLGLAENADILVSIFRALGTVMALTIVAYLSLHPQGRSPAKGAALAFMTVVILGPVVHPWYIIWIIPLFAATGVGVVGLRVAVIITAGFAIHAMGESLATADGSFDARTGVGIGIAILLIGVILYVNIRDRRWMLIGPNAPRLLPEDPPAEARARRQVMQPTWQDADS